MTKEALFTVQVQRVSVLASQKTAVYLSYTLTFDETVQELNYVNIPKSKPVDSELHHHDQTLPLHNSGRVWDPGGLERYSNLYSA